MKIIDNRYKIEKMLEDRIYYESYIISDLWEDDKHQYMKLYNHETQKDLINYFTENFIHLSSFNHDCLLANEKFNLVKTIDTKKTNMLLYYYISEYVEATRLSEVKDKLSLNDRLRIILDTILVIDYLHFRGITYKLLNPTDIFVLDDKSIKIIDIATIIEKTYNSSFNDLARYFISPQVLINREENNIAVDYYSIGILLKYLLLDNFLENDIDSFNYLFNDQLSRDQIDKINNIIVKLIKYSNVEEKQGDNKKTFLIKIVDEIIDIFSLDYTYDLVKSRDKLYFNNNIIGREKEISKFMEIDEEIENGKNTLRGLVVEAEFGIGKSRLLSEISHILELKGRNVYFTEVHESDGNDLLDMANILKQSTKDTPSELLEKYRNELSRILPELRLYNDDNSLADLKQKSERFRLYNRIANYFSELSKERIVYIIIDDLQLSNNNFLMLLDYLIRNISSKNLFFIFSFEDRNGKSIELVKEKLKQWKDDELIHSIKLHKFGLEEIGRQVQNILGMSVVPYNLSSVMFKESDGNPRYIEYIIKHLYSIGEIYMNPSGRWYVKPSSFTELYFPSDIDDAFNKQINIIKEKYYELFKVMSIFEDVLYKKTLLKMLPVENDEIERQLNELKDLKLIDEKLADWGYSYNINSSELKKLIYQELPESEKIELHGKASDVIMSLDPDKHYLNMDELINHLIKSNQEKKALDLIIEKVEGLENRYSSHARLLLEKAYNIVKYTPGFLKLKILDKIVDIYSKKGESDKRNAFLEEYLRESKLLNSHSHMIKAKNALIDIYYRQGKNSLALQEIEKIEDISNKNNILEGKIIALSLRGKFGIRMGELNLAEKQLLEALKLSQENNIINYMGVIYNRLGLIKYLMGNLDEAVEYYEKSIEYNESIGDFIEVTRPINNLANIYVDNYANSEKAMESYKKGLEITRKYGIQEVEVVFLINISNIYSYNHDFKKALEFLEDAKEIALSLQDLNNIFFIHVNIGFIYLFMSEYDKAFECYEYVINIFDANKIVDIETTLNYHTFLSHFYKSMGQWEKSIKHATIAGELCKEYNNMQYLEVQRTILQCKYYGESKLLKNDMESIMNEYRNTELKYERRDALLQFAFMSYLSGDMEYTKTLLEEDLQYQQSTSYDIEHLSTLRKLIELLMDNSENSIDKLINLQEMGINGEYDNIGLYVNLAIGVKAQSMGQFKLSLKYLLKALDMIYRFTVKIPYEEMKISFIKSRMGDIIKDKIALAIRESFNYDLDCIKLEDIKVNGLYDYFDITPIIDIVGSIEFVKITQLDYYGDALNINSISSLISSLNDDYKYNLDLILSFLGKETFAKRGYILRFDEKSNKSNIVSYLGNDPHYKINDGILKLADSSKKGFFINSSICETDSFRHSEFLTEEVKGIICVPIVLNQEPKLDKDDDRRKNSMEEQESKGYIYLDTDWVFNRFDQERFDLVRNLIYLIYINLENYNLKLMATTDKLTGTLTRKYFDDKFDYIISKAKVASNIFSVLMLDLDRFKKINDRYGHRKGDEVLSYIGHVIKSTIRSTDIVARYGGEEFIIITKNTTEEDAINVAEKIRNNIKSLKIQGIDYPITVSIGISLFPQHSQFKEDLIEKADQALYLAKETGRNKVEIWNPNMDNASNRVNKLAGIITGNTDEDNRNILALIDIIELIKDKDSLENKIYDFLGRVLETIDAEHATFISILDIKKTKIYLSRTRFRENWVDTPILNNEAVDRVIESKKGEFFIDWDNLDNVDALSGLPNWQSVIVLPMIRDEEIRGILYISTSLKKKEFNFDNFNLSKNFANIFAAML